MSDTTLDKSTLISHAVSLDSIELTIEKVAKRIMQNGDKPYVTVERQLELLNELSKFDFGRFLLQNQGINGYWTHYWVTYPWFGRETGKNNRGEPLCDLENFMLNLAPGALATQERFTIFLQESQKSVKNNATFACIPCGMMGEILYLNFKDIKHIQLMGIDYDHETLESAASLAEKQGLSPFVNLIHANAWQLNYPNEFDLICSNGLNIYEPSDDKVTELYSRFYNALKPGGKLVTSFISTPPNAPEKCEWDISKINMEHLMLQKIIFNDIIETNFHSRPFLTTKKQLESVGFTDIQVLYDRAKIFPTVIAYKK